MLRLALNYKRLPFKTVWLNMVDIKPTMQRIGASPTVLSVEPDGVYTVPVLVDASHPERPIFPEGTKALLTLFYDHFQQKFFPVLLPLLLPRTLPFLAECDHAYFRETRERWLGRLEDMCPTAAKREEQLQKLKEELNAMDKLLSKNGEGNELVVGRQVSRGDFMLVSLFVWLGTLDPEGWERVKTWNEGRWERLWKRTEEWRVNKA